MLAFTGLVATMLAALVAASAAIGIYEPLLAVEIAALAVLAAAWLIGRRARAIDALDVQRLHRHRERRGF